MGEWLTKRQKRWQRSQTFSGKVEEFVKGTKLVQMVGRLALWPRLRSGQASYYFLWPWILFICECLWAHSRGQTLSVPSSVSGQNTLPLMASPLFQWPGSPKAHKPPVGQAFGSHLRNSSPRGGAGGSMKKGADSEADVCLLLVRQIRPVSGELGPVPQGTSLSCWPCWVPP